nr:hypothetical protein [Tanacetum cinerariifolium]GEZ80089.1 hypothetical protein [Tanacetum cinerariifolium]
MDNKNKGYETFEEEEGYGEEDGSNSTEEYDLEDDCEAELDQITQTLDPHRDIEGASTSHDASEPRNGTAGKRKKQAKTTP